MAKDTLPKTSPEFVLEERGHCEVPAGCGGVILRWWNPKRELPLTVRVFATGTVDMRLDGMPLNSGLRIVGFGATRFAGQLFGERD